MYAEILIEYNNKTIDKYVKSIIDKIKLDNHIKKLEIK